MASPNEDLMRKLFLHKDFIKPPKEFKRGDNVEEFIRNVKEYCKAINASDDDLSYILINNLVDDVKYELFAFQDYTPSTEYIEAKLRWIFGYKNTATYPLIELLHVKQAMNQSVKEYASTLRVKAFQLMGNENIDRREKYLITAFQKGLLDRTKAAALKIMEPKSLTEAIELIKRDDSISGQQKIADTEQVWVMKEEKDNEIRYLKNEIRILKEKVEYLMSLSTHEKNKSAVQDINMKRISSPRKCYNCQGSNHIAKDCPKPCSICKNPNHTSYACFKRKDSKRRFTDKVRLLDEDEITEESSSEIVETDREDLYLIEKGDWITIENSNRKQSKKTYSAALKTPKKKGIDNWVQYINGNGNKPKRNIPIEHSKTLITRRRSEYAANKPIVLGKCHDYEVKIFFDSGAECNVIDESLFQKIKQVTPEVRLTPSNSNIRCASGSVMKSIGIAWLSIEVGGQISRHPFKVVKNVFPELIVGIKMMKKSGAVVIASNDCVRVGGKNVPFISKVRDEISEKSGNETGPFYRVIQRRSTKQ